MLAAPLIMSADLRAIRPEFKEILLNREAIKIDQDPLGIQVQLSDQVGVDWA
jgi:alpha-N-acetylgalactosaminidase